LAHVRQRPVWSKSRAIGREHPVAKPGFRYHRRMSKLLLNLRDVPDDEADDVRRFLDSAAIGYYETRPSFWGISGGGIWIRDERDAAEAKRLMAEYQRARQARVRAERAEAERSGTAATFADVLRTQPLRVLLAVLGIALVLGIMALPVLLLSK
jgi:hypothetical protein